MSDKSPELVEAAKIDGAGEYRIFFRIVFPLAKPVVATISLFACLNYWNDWWLGIMLIDNVEVQPLQLLLRTITSNVQFLSSAGNVNAIAQAAGYCNDRPDHIGISLCAEVFC